MNKAFCILCRTPHRGNLLIANDVLQTNMLDVIFITDNPYTPPEDVDKRIKFIHIEDSTCLELGFKHSCKFVSFSKDVVAWDKALYYFGCVNKSYDFVWLMEDDIFIPSTEILCKMTTEYTSHDLVIGRIVHHSDSWSSRWNLWHYVLPYMKQPCACGRVCGIGVSKKLFECAADFVIQNKRVPFIEGFIPTIAVSNQLKILEAPELIMISECLHNPMCKMPFHCNALNNFKIDDFIRLSKQNPTWFLHGIKKEEDYCKIYNELHKP